MRDHIIKYLNQSASTLQRMMSDDELIEKIVTAASIMSNCLDVGRKIVSCGNGGSHCDAMHFASELTGRYKKERTPLAAMAISDGAHLTCVGNDYGYDEVFARWVKAHCGFGDVLLAISTSGNSANVINAAHAAMKRGMTVVALTGKDGGELGGMPFTDIIEIRVPSDETNFIQEQHIKIIHILVELIEKNLSV